MSASTSLPPWLPRRPRVLGGPIVQDPDALNVTGSLQVGQARVELGIGPHPLVVEDASDETHEHSMQFAASAFQAPTEAYAATASSWEDEYSNQLRVAAFLADVYRRHRDGQTDRALDKIFQWVDSSLKEGQRGIELCDSVLRSVLVSRLDEDILVGFLTSTYPASRLLRSRAEFAEKVRARLASEIGREEAEALVGMLSR